MGLESLSNNGIINFDADAYIKGLPARFVGGPEDNDRYLPFDRPINDVYQPQIHGGEGGNREGKSDAFCSRHPKSKEHSSLRDFLIVGVLGGIGVFLLAKRKSISENSQGFKEKAGGFFHNVKDKVVALFKQTPKAVNSTVTTPAVSNTAKDTSKVSKIKEFFSKFKWSTMPKWGKATTIGAGAVAVIYGAHKFFGSKKSAPPPQE